MTDTHEARVEAAARRMWRDRNGTIKYHDSVRTRESDEAEMDATGYGAWDAPKYISSAVKKQYRTIASNALQAADNLVTVEKIADVIRYEVIAAVGECVCGEGYTIRNMRDPHCEWHSLGESFAEDTARAVHALLTGEEA